MIIAGDMQLVRISQRRCNKQYRIDEHFYDSDNTSGEVLNNDFTEEESFETALDVEHAIVLGFADDNFETKPVHYQDLLTRFSAFQDTVFNLFPEMHSSHYNDICSVSVDMTKERNA